MNRIYQYAFCCGHHFKRWCFEDRDFPTDVQCFNCLRNLDWKTRAPKHVDYRNRTTERGLPQNGVAKSQRIDLGIELLLRRCQRGHPKTCLEIAAWCGCSRSAIWQIESRAFRKVRKLLYQYRDKFLAEALDQLQTLE